MHLSTGLLPVTNSLGNYHGYFHNLGICAWVTSYGCVNVIIHTWFLEDSSSGIQNLGHVHSGLPAWLYVYDFMHVFFFTYYDWITECVFSFICYSAAFTRTDSQACFPISSTVYLELAATNSSDRWFSVLISRLKKFLLPPAPLKLWPYGAV